MRVTSRRGQRNLVWKYVNMEQQATERRLVYDGLHALVIFIFISKFDGIRNKVKLSLNL